MTVVQIKDKSDGPVTRDKKERSDGPQPVLYDDSDSVKEIARKLIKQYHPHLINAHFIFGCRDKAQKKSGTPSPGYVKKVSPELKWLSGAKVEGDDTADFILVVALECWNGMAPNQRTALVDHLLTKCQGEEDEKNGNMKWSLRPPEVQEFAEVAERNGRWNPELEHMAETLEGK